MSAVTAGQDIQLLIEYFDVCNDALEANREALPYKPIIAVYDKIFADRDVGIDIYESQSSRIETSATVRLRNGVIVPVPESQADPKLRFKFKRSYMEHVIAHRNDYIKHPERLDWAWLKSRLGMEVDADDKGTDARRSPRNLGPHS